MSNGATRGLKHKNINDFIREKVERIRQEIENEALKEGTTRLERGNKEMSESKHETQQEASCKFDFV
jgi:vacuolar-type H+-ATPase subunit E/Vma4